MQVIQDHAEDFLDKMNCKEIASKLKAMKLIPESTANSIQLSKDKEEANTHLLTHLKENADKREVMEIFRIASEKSGCGKMNKFAVVMLRELQGGWFDVFIAHMLLLAYLCVSTCGLLCNHTSTYMKILSALAVCHCRTFTWTSMCLCKLNLQESKQELILQHTNDYV